MVSRESYDELSIVVIVSPAKFPAVQLTAFAYDYAADYHITN